MALPNGIILFAAKIPYPHQSVAKCRMQKQELNKGNSLSSVALFAGGEGVVDNLVWPEDYQTR